MDTLLALCADGLFLDGVEVRLRFALKGVQGGQLRDMCKQVGLDVVAIRRLRIGKVSLAKMPVGQWRYLPVGDRF